MNLLQKIWNIFLKQADIWFFYGFLITSSLSVRKVLFFYPINNQFNEYTGVYLYLSDIFLLLTLLSWLLLLLYNKQSILSIIKISTVPRGTLLLPTIIVFWSFFSIFWSHNQSIAFFKSIKISEFFLLFTYITLRVFPNLQNKLFHVEHFDQHKKILRNLFKLFIFTGVINSTIAIWQFTIQHSIGLFWLKESLISPKIPGVAKLIFDGERIIRSYGLFPHPNILGGFLLISIITTLTYKKLFHVEQSTKNYTINCSTWNNSHCETYKPSKIVPRGTIFKSWKNDLVSNHSKTILFIQIIALILTFSKSAIIGLCIALAYVHKNINVPRGTILKTPGNKLFHVEHFGRKLTLSLGILLILAIITRFDTNSLFFKSLNERVLYLNVSRETIMAHPLLGIGAGQFVSEMYKFVPRGTNLEIWENQPVHNVFLLIWSELGLIGLLLFLFFLWQLFHVEQSTKNYAIKCSTWNKSSCEIYESAKNVPRGTFKDDHLFNYAFKGILLGLIFIMLFDHYLWDIQQGQIMLWIVLALLASMNTIDKN